MISAVCAIRALGADESNGRGKSDTCGKSSRSNLCDNSDKCVSRAPPIASFSLEIRTATLRPGMAGVNKQ